ncbi:MULTISPECIES: hypothetical protein [unclassified Streptomyces]|uniref:hypothetical protein n=1 Tax=unclassified Streptomyces TaxID=2593676 RepID=UPI00362B8DD0
MSGEQSDLAVPPEALALIARGIDKAHAELKDLGMIGEASMGRGFSDLALSGVELGHDGLAAEFTTFCERWEWGVRALMGRGNGFARGVGLSAGAFHEQDQYVKDTIKIVANGSNGNPHLSEDEVRGMTWDEIRLQSPTDGADWNRESFSQAHGEVKQLWRDTAYDVEDGALDSLGNSGLLAPEVREVLDEEMRETLDPSDEAIQRAEQPTWADR